MVTPVSRQRHKLSRETGGGRSLPSQIAQQFRDKIERGEWRVGGPLPTTRQLAKDYRVSLNTVQSAFRELQASDLIERVPRRGGFVKARSSDIVAAARARQGTLVGIVTPFPPEASEEQGDDWSKRITHAAEGMLLEKGLHLSMFSYPLGDTDPAGHILARVDQMGPDLAGMICFSRPAIAGLTDELDRRSIPWVSINRAAEQAQHNFVTASNFHGGRTVGRCFARLGYDRVAVLCNRMEPGSSSGDKFFGFIQGYLESGKLLRNVDCLPCDDITGASGYDAIGKYIDQYGKPQGIFTTGDYLALGAVRLCRERGIAVPEEVGVVGATGLHVAAYAHPALTVLAQPMEQMGQEAASMLLKIIGEGVRRVPGQFIPSPFIFRESLLVPDELRAELEAFTQSQQTST
jgi:DNA-binding LacI/PurR family transcriptional regulator